MNKSFNQNFIDLFKSIDKSKNRLVTITDRKGNVKKVWKHIESGEEKKAGINAGKSYEKTGKRHTSHSGFESGDAVLLTVGDKQIKGIFRHVNESKHSTVAVIRGEDNKLYERGLSKIQKFIISKENKDNLEIFRNIVMSSKDLNHAYDLISKIKNVSKETSNQFRKLYDPNSKLTPRQAFESFYNDVKSITQEEKEHSKTYQKLKIDAKDGKLDTSKKEFAEDIKNDHKNEEKLFTPLRNKTNRIGIGDNVSIKFTDKSKQKWNRGDSVSYTDKNGKEKTGRVLKVDDDLKVTYIRQPSGFTEAIPNKNVKN